MVKETHSLQERWALVVGGSSGVGRALAVKLLKNNWHVILLVRGGVDIAASKKQLAMEAKFQVAGKANPFEVKDLDLGDIQLVRDFAYNIIRRRLRLQLLAICAGENLGLAAEEETHDGVEYAFGTNYIASFLLASLLTPALARSQPSSIMTVIGGASHAKKMEVNMELVRQQLAMIEQADGMLKVHIVQASNLSTDFGPGGTCNPFIKVSVGEEVRVTPVKHKVHAGHILFNEHLQIRTKEIERPVKFEIFHKDKKHGERSMGTFSIGFDAFAEDPAQRSMHSLKGEFKLEKAPEAKSTADKTKLAERLAKTELFRSTRQVYRTNKAAQYEPEAREIGIDLVDVDKANNVIRFAVTKRLNFLFRGKRTINVDLTNKVVRNVTPKGKERKSFPFKQLLSMVVSADDPHKLSLTFIQQDILDDNQNFVAYGGQRDYALQFFSEDQRSLFVEVMKHHIASTPQRNGSKVVYNVVKRLNALQQGQRQLIVDEEEKTLCNHEHVLVEGDDLPEHETFRKKIHFWQLLSVVEDEKKQNNLRIQFSGGQQDYKIEFLTPEQKDHFIRLLLEYLPLRIGGAVTLEMKFQGHTYGRKIDHFHHRMPCRTTELPADLLYVKSQPNQAGVPLLPGSKWMTEEQLTLPKQPDWFKSLGSTYRGNYTRSQLNAHAAVCLLALSLELTARIREQFRELSVFTVDAASFPAASPSVFYEDGTFDYQMRGATFEPHDVAEELLRLLPDEGAQVPSSYLQLSKSLTGGLVAKREAVEVSGGPKAEKKSRLTPALDTCVIKPLWHETASVLYCDVDSSDPKRGDLLPSYGY